MAEAITHLEASVEAAKKNPRLAWVSGELLKAYVKAGEKAKLASLLQGQLAEARKTLPKDSPQLAGALALVGMGFLNLENWTAAEPLLREVLSIRQRTEPELWTTFNTKSVLGGTLLGQNKYAEAEPLLIAGYEGMKQREKSIPLQARVRMAEAIERLVQLYEATKKPDEAAKWRKQLEERKEADKKPIKP